MSDEQCIPELGRGVRPQIRVGRLNLDATRRYLAGLEKLCREARTSTDPRVLRTALEILGIQASIINSLTEAS